MSLHPIAVVIPALNEAAVIGATLEALAGAGVAETVVVDGGSGDDTVRLAGATPGVRVLAAVRGRASQMNAGAEATTAPVVLFLHADTRLPGGAAGLIGAALDDPGVVGGCFRGGFDSNHPLLAISAWFSRIDSYWTSFGDHAFFVRRSAFEAVGGFPDWPLLEDVALRRRLRRIGRFVKLPAAVVTSARRFEAEGVLRRQLTNGLILGAHALGVSARRLKGWYR